MHTPLCVCLSCTGSVCVVTFWVLLTQLHAPQQGEREGGVAWLPLQNAAFSGDTQQYLHCSVATHPVWGRQTRSGLFAHAVCTVPRK